MRNTKCYHSIDFSTPRSLQLEDSHIRQTPWSVFQDGSDNNANNVKMNKRKQNEAKLNYPTVAEATEIKITTTDEQEQSLLS